MTRSVAEANSAVTRIRHLPYGVARSTAASAELERITAEGPPEARAYALYASVEAFVWGGEVDKAFLPFTQMVRWWDAHPEYFDADDQHSLFWSFKWMVSHLMEFPTIPAAQIDATLADMQHRYALAGNGMDAVAMSRFRWAAMRGAPDTEELFTAWITTPRDDFSQCEACDPGDRAAHLYATGRYSECIRLIEQTLPDRPSCATEPGDMLSYLQLACVHVGDDAGAARAHRAATQHLPADVLAARTRGRHLEFLARTGNASRALGRLAEDQRLCTHAETPYDRWDFLRAVALAMELLRPEYGQRPVRVADVPATTVAELADWARHEALALAGQFDARNASTAMSERTRASWADLTRLPVDLSVFGSFARAGADHGAPERDPREVPADAADAEATPPRGAHQPAASTLAADHTSPASTALPPLTVDDVAALTVDDVATGPAALLARAEQLTRTDPIQAARAYAEAADALRAAGRLEGAGFAQAEAAMWASRAGDDEGACARFASAVSLLRGARTPARYVGPVVRAWARRAAPANIETLVPLVDSLREELAAPVSTEGIAADLAERRERERAVEGRRLDDTRARIAATVNDPGAPALAEASAEAFARAGEFADAAYAFWLLGELRPDGSDAVYALESAVEGFALARRHEERRAVGDELVALLQRLGRLEDAEKLALSLSENT